MPINASCASGRLRLGPCQEHRARERGGAGRRLRGPALDRQAEAARRDHAESRDLRDRKVDEHDAARKHLLAERHVRDHDEDARDQRRPENAEIGT